MLVGILADTHDHIDRIDRAIRVLKKEGITELIHAGDIVAPFAAKAVMEWSGPLHVVYGNNDGERRGLKSVLPQIEDGPILVECDGRRISVDHYPPDDVHRPIENVDLVLFGHTHQILQEERDGMRLLNPGECCGWVTGTATIATLDTISMKVDIIQID